MLKNFIHDTKIGLTLTKYGIKAKMQFAMATLFFIIGVIVDIFSNGSSYIGGFYVVLSGMFIFQSIISIDASTLIQSSGYKKKIQVAYPYYAIIPIVTVFYTIIVIVHAKMAGSTMGGLTVEENYNRQVVYLFAMNALLFVTLVYFGVCYKYFIVGMILLLIAVLPLSMATFAEEEWICAHFTLSQVIIIGYVLMIVGFIVSILISKLLYRKPLSKVAVRVNR